MENFKGTPGPWVLGNNDSTGETCKPIVRGKGRMVCMLPPISPDNEANAQLIATAPELLFALQRVKNVMEHYAVYDVVETLNSVDRFEYTDALDAARLAIEKATDI
jgi:hypothetical protein